MLQIKSLWSYYTFWPLRVTYISLMFAFAVCYTCCSCAGILGNAKGIVGWFNAASIGAPCSGLHFGLLCKAYLCLSCPGLQFALSINVACCSDCWNHLQLGPHMISVCGDAKLLTVAGFHSLQSFQGCIQTLVPG